jgi:tRNA A37 threonylcarbamoyladenosine dehydratase
MRVASRKTAWRGSSERAPVSLERRFAGLARLLGSEPAARVYEAHVAVVGLGGVGSWAAEALARSGVAALTLIDLDHVSESNINRQIHALTPSLGMSKVEAMRQRIALINPDCRVTTVDAFVEPDNWPSILPVDVDAVIDACDQLPAKLAMARWARDTQAVFVTVGAAGGKRMAQDVEIADLGQVTHDPLLAKMRYQLRRLPGAPAQGKPLGVACVFSREAVQAPPASCEGTSDGSLNCQGYGSLVTVTATFGLCAAGWAMEKISCLGKMPNKRRL